MRRAAALGTEPNLLAWCVGDDIYPNGIDGLFQTARILRSIDPNIPTIGDCYAGLWKSPGALEKWNESVDITLNYDYPLPNEEYPIEANIFRRHMRFFDMTRERFGDPRWTWTQAYMWHWTGQDLNVGERGPGPYPEPEQARLLCFAEINSGIRGLLFYSHREIELQPNLASAVALTFREITLFNDHLAAGALTQHLETSERELEFDARW